MEGKYNVNSDSVCLGSSSRAHVWDDVTIVTMPDGTYSEISCTAKGCYAIDRVFLTQLAAFCRFTPFLHKPFQLAF